MKTSYNIDYELIFVDDGSKDNTLFMLKDLSAQNQKVKFISFSRNFGKESAMYAGLQNAHGDYVVVMDADLQHPPQFIPEMYTAVALGEYDSATTRRTSRQGESEIRSFFSIIFYKLMNKISDADIVEGAQDFRFMTRQMVDSILQLSEYNRFSKGIFSWVGFKTKYLEYENVERVAGRTKWSFLNLLAYSLEGIFAFSTTPLYISSFLGIIFCLFSIIMIFIIIIKTVIWGDPVAGFPTLICVIFFIGGLQLFCNGIVGQYLAKAYLEVKNRPIYIVKEKNTDATRKCE